MGEFYPLLVMCVGVAFVVVTIISFRVHAFLDARQVHVFLLQVDPGLEAFAHRAHPLAGIHGQVADQLEDRQRRQRDVRAEILGERAARQTGPAVDQHRATATDARAADEVELQRRVLVFADLGQGDEQRHAGRFLDLIGLQTRDGTGFLRVVAQHADTELAAFRVGVVHRTSALRSSIRSLGPRKRSGSRCS